MTNQYAIKVDFCGQIEAEDFKFVKLKLRLTWESVYCLEAALKSMIQDSKDHYSIRRACQLLDQLDYIHVQSYELHTQVKP